MALHSMSCGVGHPMLDQHRTRNDSPARARAYTQRRVMDLPQRPVADEG